MSLLTILALVIGLPYAALVTVLVYLTVRDLLDRAGTVKSPAHQASAGDASENEAARTAYGDARKGALKFVGWDRR